VGYADREGGNVKRLTRHGHTLATVIDRRVFDLLDIDAQTLTEPVTDGKGVVV